MLAACESRQDGGGGTATDSGGRAEPWKPVLDGESDVGGRVSTRGTAPWCEGSLICIFPGAHFIPQLIQTPAMGRGGLAFGV